MMTQRFLRSRWSQTRRDIDAMTLHQVLTFPASEYNNVNTSVTRSNDAYAGEKEWMMTTTGRASTVTRIR